MTEPAIRATSHLIVYVADTDASLAFWRDGLGGVVEHDEELEAPALDAIFGRKGVRIRDTFIRVGGTRLHTIEALDVPYAGPARVPRTPGIEGISFEVPDLEASHDQLGDAGFSPTAIHDFPDAAPPCRMFFLDDPDGIRVEMIEYQP